MRLISSFEATPASGFALGETDDDAASQSDLLRCSHCRQPVLDLLLLICRQLECRCRTGHVRGYADHIVCPVICRTLRWRGPKSVITSSAFSTNSQLTIRFATSNGTLTARFPSRMALKWRLSNNVNLGKLRSQSLRRFDRLRAKHPGLEIESCSGRGGRVDLGDSPESRGSLAIRQHGGVRPPQNSGGLHPGVHTEGHVGMGDRRSQHEPSQCAPVSRRRCRARSAREPESLDRCRSGPGGEDDSGVQANSSHHSDRKPLPAAVLLRRR